jgi:integrase
MTDTWLKNLKPETALKPGVLQKDFFDEGETGLVLRLTNAGKKTWNFIFTPPDGKRARMWVGVYPTMGLADARKAVREQRDVINAGRDPRKKPVEGMTMKALIALRIKAVGPQIDEKTGRVKKAGLRTAKEVERKYRQYVLPFVGDLPVKDFKIDEHFFGMILNPIYDRGKIRMAGLVGVELKTLFDLAEGRGIVPHSPVAKAKFDLGMVAKERFLSTTEITQFWDELPDAIENVAYQRILKLIMLTGCRLSEICKLHRDEVNLKARWLIIGRERVKNGKKYGAFKVPLNDQAIVILREAMRDTNNPDWVFPKTKGKNAGNAPIEHHVIDRELARAFEAGKFKTAKLTPHDLRRTMATNMRNKNNKLGIKPHDVSAVLNHRSVETVTDEHYDMNDYLDEYLDEKREALEKWGAFIDSLVRAPDEQREAA